ncbi:hypothetical protein AB0O01_29065 [Streptomyces sp. NPDC093252]|uniref:hypothetical protein n=1 Tax=Streptomyces sp. NPDC093252 TaxID=3154980 RepID=UPI00342C7951
MSFPAPPGLFAAIERECADRDPMPALRRVATTECRSDDRHLTPALHHSGTSAPIEGPPPAQGPSPAEGPSPVPDPPSEWGTPPGQGGPPGRGAPLTLHEARRLLYDRSTHPTERNALWRQIAVRSHDTTDHADWPPAAVWLGLPGLFRTAHRITRDFGAERDDVEAELITCYLEALAEVREREADPGGRAGGSDPGEAGGGGSPLTRDPAALGADLGPHALDLGGHVLRSACSRAWTLFRTARPEIAVDDIETHGRRETDVCGPWQVDYDPPGLSATVRFLVPAERIEGVRIGALAQAWGLAEDATCTRYSGRGGGRAVATLSLRRAGRNP